MKKNVETRPNYKSLYRWATVGGVLFLGATAALELAPIAVADGTLLILGLLAAFATGDSGTRYGTLATLGVIIWRVLIG